jgi:hypothetical protein
MIAAELKAVPPFILGLILIAIGLALMFLGWKIYRVALAVVGALLGAVGGLALGAVMGLPALIPAVILAVAGAILAILLEKVGAFFIGAFTGILPILAMQGQFKSQAMFIFALVLAAVIGGVMALYLWRPMITVGMAVIGATMIVNGGLLVWYQFQPKPAEAFATEHPLIVAVIVVILAIIGTYYQKSEEEGEG